jgi:hypothetical protein
MGSRFMPGALYESLTKPLWNPSNAIFGPVWFAVGDFQHRICQNEMNWQLLRSQFLHNKEKQFTAKARGTLRKSLTVVVNR